MVCFCLALEFGRLPSRFDASNLVFLIFTWDVFSFTRSDPLLQRDNLMKRANESAKKSSTDKTSDEPEQVSHQVLLLALALTVDFFLVLVSLIANIAKESGIWLRWYTLTRTSSPFSFLPKKNNIINKTLKVMKPEGKVWLLSDPVIVNWLFSDPVIVNWLFSCPVIVNWLFSRTVIVNWPCFFRNL